MALQISQSGRKDLWTYLDTITSVLYPGSAILPQWGPITFNVVFQFLCVFHINETVLLLKLDAVMIQKPMNHLDLMKIIERILKIKVFQYQYDFGDLLVKFALVECGVRSCIFSPFQYCTPILDWSEKKNQFQSENTLTWLKMMGKSSTFTTHK